MAFFLFPTLKTVAAKVTSILTRSDYSFSQDSDFSDTFESWSALGTFGYVFSENSDFSDDFEEDGWPPPWTPEDITTAAWIDASDTSSYTLNGSFLTSVTDKAGNFTIGIDGTPTRRLADLNGRNVFDFDGSESLISSNSGPYASSGNHWAIGVFEWHSLSSTKNSFFSADGNRTYAVSSGGTSSWPGEIDYDGNNSIVSGVAKNQFTTSISSNTWAIVSIVFNKTGNQIFGRLNGTTRTSTHSYNNSIDTNCSDLRMMRNRSGVKLNGRMAEYFHVAGTPGTGGTNISDVEKAEGYLAHKWGLASNLPSNHPYKNSAP